MLKKMIVETPGEAAVQVQQQNTWLQSQHLSQSIGLSIDILTTSQYILFTRYI